MSVVHDFGESLTKSHAAEDMPFWEEVYRSAFPGFVGMHNHRADGYWQRSGVDRSVVLDSSKQILIDEKVRYTTYNDIALEYISNDQRDTPGWVCKPLLADYIAYAFVTTGKCYLLPVIQLQSAWTKNMRDWMPQYRKIVARNSSYNTLSLAVPTDVLFRAIGACLRVTFTVPREAEQQQPNHAKKPQLLLFE